MYYTDICKKQQNYSKIALLNLLCKLLTFQYGFTICQIP